MSLGPIWRRRAIAIGVIVLALLAGYRFWLRDSSLVAVEEVTVEGATTNTERISAELERVGLEMTTLHIDDEALRDAVASFPTVASVRADADLLHSLTIVVTERLPVARVKVGAEVVPVSADGYLLRGVSTDDGKLPSLRATAEGVRLDPDGIAQAAVLGSAPAAVAERVSGSSSDAEHGVIVELPGAPELRFGDGEDAEEKWRAVAVVLADDELGSPAYLDVSVPERPVTGG